MISPSPEGLGDGLDSQQYLLFREDLRDGPTGWMVRGACRGVDPELFCPISAQGRAVEQIDSAKAVCGRCAVGGTCLSYALRTMPDGISGRTTREERIAMRIHAAPKTKSSRERVP